MGNCEDSLSSLQRFVLMEVSSCSVSHLEDMDRIVGNVKQDTIFGGVFLIE